MGHQSNGAWPIQNHGEPAVLLCFIFLFFAAYGGEEYSLNGVKKRRGGGAAHPDAAMHRAG